VAGALAGVLTPLAAHASLTIKLQLAPGAAGATQTVAYLDPTMNGTDIPVYVYATVTGTQATDFQGFQYAYYNVNTAVAPGSGVGITPTLDTGTTKMTNETSAGNAAYNLAGNGSTIGSAANLGSGILAGSTTTLSDIAHARSASDAPIWANTSTQGSSYSSGASTSFLIETLEVQPGAFAPSTTAANGQNYSKFSVSIPNVSGLAGGGPEYVTANWNEDSTSNSTESTSSIKNSTTGTYSAATGFVTLEDTLKGDVNHDGVVTLTDIGIVINNYKTVQTWEGGNFESPGSSTVTLTDIGDAINNYKQNLNTITPTLLQDVVSDADAGGDPALAAEASAALASVPEPASLGLLAVAGAAMLTRRRRSTR
jgi:hypothetical protein